MRLRISTISILLSISVAASLVPAAAWACAGGDFEIEDVSFFTPEIIQREAEAPFFFTPHKLYGNAGDSAPDLAAVNLREWDEFFQGKLPAAAWSEVLYKAPLPRLDNLIFALKGKAAPAAGDEPFMAFADREALIAALFYVGFAKRVEPIAMEYADVLNWEWAEKHKKIDRVARATSIATLLDGGGKAMASAKNPLLRQRYALQLLRLHFYDHQDAASVKLYEDHRAADFSGQTSVAWRAMGYYAGSLSRLGRVAEANYAYSILFDQYQPLKVSAFSSFRPIADADWKKALALARSPREKAILWQMLGVAADGLRGMKEIAAIDRKSDLLPLLLVREVNHAEMDLRGAPDRLASFKSERKDLLAFIDANAEKGDVANPALWDVASGHLHALFGEGAAAKKSLDRAEGRAPKAPAIQAQIRLSQLFAVLNSMDSVSSADEPLLARELSWAKAESKKSALSIQRVGSFVSWSRQRLSSLYRKKGDVVTALCFQDSDDPLYLDPEQIDRYVSFLKKPGKSAFEAMAAGFSEASENSLQEYKGLLAFYRGDLEKAAALLAPVKTGLLAADPFEIHIVDCHDCDQAAKHKDLTKSQFVARLVALQKEATSNGAKAAEDYFQIANGLYNATYWGNNRPMYVTNSWHLVRKPLTFDTANAEGYYRKAFEVSKEREFKAKAAFMAAKCESFAKYAKNPDYKEDYSGGTWFASLRDSYADTRYYKEIVHECGYFKEFAKRHPKGK